MRQLSSASTRTPAIARCERPTPELRSQEGEADRRPLESFVGPSGMTVTSSLPDGHLDRRNCPPARQPWSSGFETQTKGALQARSRQFASRGPSHRRPVKSDPPGAPRVGAVYSTPPHGSPDMRSVLSVGLTALITAPAVAGIDLEARTPYQLRVVVRTGDHPALTRHFRADVKKALGSALQTALGSLGTVEVIDLNETAADKLDPLARLAHEKGLEALDVVTATAPAKTHFVFVDFADGKYEIRSRQHDGTTGFVTPIVRKTVHADRGFVGRLAGLAGAQA